MPLQVSSEFPARCWIPSPSPSAPKPLAHEDGGVRGFQSSSEAAPLEDEAADHEVFSAASENKMPVACLVKQLLGDHKSIYRCAPVVEWSDCHRQGEKNVDVILDALDFFFEISDFHRRKP